MSDHKNIEGVYVITDTEIQNRYNHVDLSRFAVAGGASVVQLRDKRMGAAQKLQVLKNMIAACGDSDCRCIVNNRVDLCMASQADGVHLGQQDLPIQRTLQLLGSERIVGGTASTLEEASKVEEAGADYIGFGHIFDTRTKTKDYEPRGLDMLSEVVSEVSIPVIAIGGITASNAKEVIQAGAAGFAVTSAVCKADNPEKAVRQLVKIYNANQ